MKHVLAVLSALGMLLGSIGGVVPASATHLPTRIADGSGPRTDGAWLTWIDKPEESYRQLLATRLDSSEPIPVTNPDVLIYGYDLDDGVVVWSEPDSGCQNQVGELCNQAIYARNLQTGQVIEVAATEDVEEWPVISGSRVVWNAWDGESWHIRSRDIATMSEPVTIFSENQSVTDQKYEFPVVSGSLVAWATYWESEDPNTSFGWQLWVRNLDTDAAAQPVADGLGSLRVFDLEGTTLVYAAFDDQLFVVDLEGQATESLADVALDVTTDGRYVSWIIGDEADNIASNGTTLRIYDLATGAIFAIEAGDRYSLHPHLAGGWLTWEQGGLPFPDHEYRHDIHAAPLVDLLPSGRRPPADVTIPEIIYYPETGHYLGGGFRLFWDGNGGLPVFGYPMTEEYSERNQDSAHFHTTQFFERQRFEWHPENAGTPYLVLLGRLGYEDAAARGLLAGTAFQPILHDIVRGDCVWFGETRQMACTDFIDYWRSHGLDFGDDGTSYRESLALFGYPISQPYIDPDTGLLTQYFERAVFELHPNNPAPYRVLLRRLGAEVLALRDW